MAKLDDRQRLINRINARLRSYKLTPEQLKIVQSDLSSIEGVYPTKKGIAIEKKAWTMNGPDIEAALGYKVKTQKERRKEAAAELRAVGGKEAATTEAINAKMDSKLYTDSVFQEIYEKYYDLMPDQEEINPADLREDKEKQQLYDDMRTFGSLVRHKDDEALSYKNKILSEIAAIRKRDGV